ncbi:Gfo/Idh/MocA family oxidoreductase [Chromobacterium vaccinii]|uniref:Gfo/Idh/MocA family protein n=1 Tax=Chromobacterium vaccinii TaxID=1108595 RepID=UPI001E333144|nr:Gfo/Idh/MocA family oxidoreductase [Chromobacterium vaccinii]MCD4486820.1 Gfo/Idh/MocA family oxidoreductase [Chromobacterium vaccinii]
MLKVAILGCGYMAYYYAMAAFNHRALFSICGGYDTDEQRASRWAAHFQARAYPSFDALLADPDIDIVVNLTPPQQHFDANLRILRSGKHLYSEKPLAMTGDQARILQRVAQLHGVLLGAAPSCLLSPAVTLAAQLLEQGAIGRPRFLHLSMHDFRVDLARPERWINPLGVGWPYANEFETGCTAEHSAYSLSIALAWFGPVKSVDSLTRTAIPDKRVAGAPLPPGPSPDFTTSVLDFANGVTGHLTCGIVCDIADRSIAIHGDEGSLALEDCWDYFSPLRLSRRRPLGGGQHVETRTIAPERGAGFVHDYGMEMDQCMGIANLCLAIRNHSPLLCGGELAIHATELCERISNGGSARLDASFQPLSAQPWTAAARAALGAPPLIAWRQEQGTPAAALPASKTIAGIHLDTLPAMPAAPACLYAAGNDSELPRRLEETLAAGLPAYLPPSRFAQLLLRNGPRPDLSSPWLKSGLPAGYRADIRDALRQSLPPKQLETLRWEWTTAAPADRLADALALCGLLADWPDAPVELRFGPNQRDDIRLDLQWSNGPRIEMRIRRGEADAIQAHASLRGMAEFIVPEAWLAAALRPDPEAALRQLSWRVRLPAHHADWQPAHSFRFAALLYALPAPAQALFH